MRTSSREYSPRLPVKRCGRPRTLSARRKGSASLLLRTRIARSRGRKPCRQALVDHRRHAVGLRGHGVVVEVAHRRARLALRAQALVDAGDDLQPVGVVVGDEPRRPRRGSTCVERWFSVSTTCARARVELAEGEQVRRRGAAPAVDRLVVVAHHGDVGGLGVRRPGAPARAARGWCPGTRPRGCSGSARAASRAARAARAGRTAPGEIWSPKSTAPASPSSSW